MAAGVRWALTTRHSCGTSNRFNTSAACDSVSQSDVLPMIKPTSGEAVGVDICRIYAGRSRDAKRRGGCMITRSLTEVIYG